MQQPEQISCKTTHTTFNPLIEYKHMNNKLIFLISISISFLAFQACKKEKKSTSSATSFFSTSFSLKHNGMLYTTNSPNVTTNSSWLGITAGTIGATGNYYQIGINKHLTPGTYQYTGSMDDVMVFLVISNQVIYAENHGSITILSNDTVAKRMEFNFEFEMLENNTHADTIQITEGHAKISY